MLSVNKPLRGSGGFCSTWLSFVDNENLIQNKDVRRSFAGKEFRCRLFFRPVRKSWALRILSMSASTCMTINDVVIVILS